MKIASRLVEAYQVPGVKMAWISENKPLNPDDCPNCGGLGFQAAFIATHGPLKMPVAAYSGKSSKYWKGSWWAGLTLTAPCPVCCGHTREDK
jgi:hypothetical protein